MNSLREHIKNNIDIDEDDIYYNESFCNITQDYLGSKGEFSMDDILYLKENEYRPEDFYY